MLNLLALGGGIRDKFKFLITFCVCQVSYNKNILQSQFSSSVIIMHLHSYKDPIV